MLSNLIFSLFVLFNLLTISANSLISYQISPFISSGRARWSLGESRNRTYNVSTIVINNKYLELITTFNATKQGYFNWDYDIALLKLNSSVTNEVEVIALPSGSLNVSNAPSLRCTAAGMCIQHRHQILIG